MEFNMKYFFEKYYSFEINNKNRLDEQVRIPITLLTISGGGIIYFSNNFPTIIEMNNLLIKFLLYIFNGISIVSFIISAIFVGLILKGFEYKNLPKPQFIYDYIDKLKNYYSHSYFSTYNKTTIKKMLDDDIEYFFLDKYLEISSHNRKINDRKSKFLYWSKVFIVISIFSIFINYSIFYFSFNYKIITIKKMEVIEKCLTNNNTISNSNKTINQ